MEVTESLKGRTARELRARPGRQIRSGTIYAHWISRGTNCLGGPPAADVEMVGIFGGEMHRLDEVEIID